MAIVIQINNFRILAGFKAQAKSGDLNPEKRLKLLLNFHFKKIIQTYKTSYDILSD